MSKPIPGEASVWIRVNQGTEIAEGRGYLAMAYQTDVPGLVAFESPGIGWTVTHVASGRRIPELDLCCLKAAKEEARAYAEAMLPDGEINLDTARAISAVRKALKGAPSGVGVSSM
jgi:hypothetical protein